ELANHLQGFLHVLPAIQRANVGELDGRAVGHRVGERHAQLDHVGTGVRQALEDAQRGGVGGVAGGDEGHQRCAVFRFQFGETVLQAAHACFSCSPMWCITVCMSLSPRPDRLITIKASLGSCGARLKASASAWALSRAGMMPSRRQQWWKASRASLSLIGTYSTRLISCSQACSGPTPG